MQLLAPSGAPTPSIFPVRRSVGEPVSSHQLAQAIATPLRRTHDTIATRARPTEGLEAQGLADSFIESPKGRTVLEHVGDRAIGVVS